MVSGTGPKETLKKYNIPVLSDLPGEGQGLHDPPLYALVYSVSVTTSSSLINATYAAQASNQAGPLTDPGTNELGSEKLPASSRANLSANALSLLSQIPSDWPEIEYVTFAGDLSRTITAPGQYATFGVGLAAPLSRGNVTIISADTVDRPLIGLN
ncbi:hypothetical protein IMSHALPRED_009944 [Imshaugia aleurites]|uniref:Uncharacterized protein n=1 Tax=Imshaugia aleurites TaxID=172621 RepID=A0A8H3ET25_9LECA|nr:hypothetical protein IMSHALPRED_009944 [Imshaugia aleurites]